MDWRDIETRGYVMVPGWLGEAELAVLRADYGAGAPASEFDLGYKPVTQAGLDVFASRVPSALAELAAQTSLDVDQLLNGFYFATDHAKKTSFWHQDYDAYYKLSHDHVSYLNFYVPITKPDRERSNVRVVPFDSLASSAAPLAAHLRGGGANFVTQRGRIVTIENTDVKAKHELELDVTIEALAITPALGEGDLLLMRGDLLHRSQDLRTPRVSASVRFGSSRYGYEAKTNLAWFRDSRRPPG